MSKAVRNPLLVQFASEPCLFEPNQGERVAASLDAVMAHPRSTELIEEQAYNDDNFWPSEGDWRADYRPYVVKNGILHIPVRGVLLHNFPWALGGWATGYVYIQRAFERGMQDAGVRAVALIIDSPGGQVAGCFDALDKMIAAKSKPVRAFAHEAAYSAAYAMACAADHIAVSRTGGVGSVGVVTTHVDMSGALEQWGLKVTYIFAGKHKVDGNPTAPLPAEVKDRIQQRVDALYEVFVSAVARGRDMDEQAVRDSEALTFTAAEAVSNGFADSIGSLDDAVAVFAADLDDQSDNQGEDAMADEANQSAVDQAALDAAREEGRAAAVQENEAAVAQARTDERNLVFAILDSDEGKERPAAARALAAEGGRTLEQATTFLARLPKEQAPAAAAPASTGQSFDDAMSENAPNVGAQPGDEQGSEDSAADVLALAAQCGVKGFIVEQKN